MARLLTSGFELNHAASVTSSPDGNFSAGATAVARESTIVRSGGFSAKCDTGAGLATCFVGFQSTWVLSTTYYLRAYFRFASLPSAGNNAAIMTMGADTLNGATMRVRDTGACLIQRNGGGGAQVGSDSTTLLVVNTWYRLELVMATDASNHTSSISGYIDGVQFATGSVSTTEAITSQFSLGWMNAPSANIVVYVDDVALNDSTGGSQNSFPGAGNVVLLIPTSDSASGTGWVLGNNTAEGGNGWNSVNNEPPTGVADLSGAGADSAQIRNATAAANSNFDANMTTYTAAGVGAGATINVVDPITATAAPVATSAKQGTVGVASNPTIANIALAAGGTSGAFWSGSAGGTYITGWKWSHGTTTYAPSVTLGTAPVMRVTQVTSSTRIAVVCFMGIYVDYTPSASGLAPPERVVLQAVSRASFL